MYKICMYSLKKNKKHTPRYPLPSLQNRTLPAPGKSVRLSLKHSLPTVSPSVFIIPLLFFIVLPLVMYPQAIWGGL